jgi:hypothetical protein
MKPHDGDIVVGYRPALLSSRSLQCRLAARGCHLQHQDGGGTVFHFVSEEIEAALERAPEAAGEKSVSIVGGPSVLNQYLVDEMRAPR